MRQTHYWVSHICIDIIGQIPMILISHANFRPRPLLRPNGLAFSLRNHIPTSISNPAPLTVKNKSHFPLNPLAPRADTLYMGDTTSDHGDNMGTAYAKVTIEKTTVKIRVRGTDTPEGAYHRALCKVLRDNLANKRTESWNANTYYMVAEGDNGPVYWAEDREQHQQNMINIGRAIVRAN